MATSTPQVLMLAPDEVRKRCGRLQRLLGVNGYEACELLVARPALLLLPDGKGALASAGDLPALVAKAQEVAMVLEASPAVAMNALCRAAPRELAMVMGMGRVQLQQQVADLQAAIFPRERVRPQAAAAATSHAPAHAIPPAAAVSPSAAAVRSASQATIGEGAMATLARAAGGENEGHAVVSSRSGGDGDAAVDGAVVDRGSEGEAVRRRLVCSLLLKWPGLLATPPSQVATNMAQLGRRLRLPPRRVAVLAARVPLLLAEPISTLEARLAGLCAVLQVQRQQLLQLLVATPLLLRQAPSEVRERINGLHRLLALPQDAALDLVCREPNLLRYPPLQMRHKLTRVAAALNVSASVARVLVARVPVLLLASPPTLSARVSDLGLVLGVPPARVVQMAMRLPRLLLYDVGKLRAHYEGQAKLWASTGGGAQDAGLGGMQQLVVQHPWLLLLPAAAIIARAAAVAAVLQVAPTVVLCMARRNPVLLARTAEWVQATADIITQELRVGREVATAVLQRAPVLLAYDQATTLTKCRRLRRLAETHPCWQEQLGSCLPDELATCLRYGGNTFGRLQWLAEAGLQREVSMVDTAVRDPLLFLRCFPAADRRTAALQRLWDQKNEQKLQPKDIGHAEQSHEHSAGGYAAALQAPAKAIRNANAEEVEDALLNDAAGHEGAQVPLSRWEADEHLAARAAAERPRKEEGEGRSAGRSGRRKWVGGGRPASSDFF